jgi:hypothetical protein
MPGQSSSSPTKAAAPLVSSRTREVPVQAIVVDGRVKPGHDVRVWYPNKNVMPGLDPGIRDVVAKGKPMEKQPLAPAFAV